MTVEVRRLAHAKVNPYLQVLGRRGDGYHDIETLVHPIDLADELTVRQIEGSDMRLQEPARSPGKSRQRARTSS